MTAGSAQMRRAIAERLCRDPEFKALLITDRSAAEAAIRPRELVSYELASSESKDGCGSVCGCDASAGVGCEGDNGKNDAGSDCPKKQGVCNERVGSG